MSKNKNNTNVEPKITIILIVDDHPIVRDGLASLINLEADLVVSAKAGNVAEAIKAVSDQQIDVAVVDMLLKDETGIQVTKKIRAICPNLIVLIFSMSDDLVYVKQAFGAGAMGYITKDEISEDIVKAIRHILKGQIYIGNNLRKNLPQKELDSLLASNV